ncbi:putative ankyrin repeat protein RF_0381 [Impatiens glandulifera]|uniref:putative ankyrin repeat protein RF_0381 n=1 Tax=Impatiens glandulifera TaxID=253017 RepID=UPI001FB17FEE|nr:putative ankyrin repeat protein RF_0381 [Impatiens glandulifera]
MVLIPNSKQHVIQFCINGIHDVFYHEDDFSSSEYDFSSSDSDFNISDEEDTIKTNENNIAPHFKDMALAIKKRDVNGLQIALDNFTGDIDEYSIDGETALHYACKCYSRKSFELLVGRGANMEAKNKVGDIPLHTACDIGLFNIVKFIFNNISDGDIRKRMLNSIDSDGSTPMHKAASENIKIVELLLDIIIETDNSTGISKMIQAVNTYGDTPLHEAALYGKVKIVKLLLELGASTQTRNNDGMIDMDSFQFEMKNDKNNSVEVTDDLHDKEKDDDNDIGFGGLNI